MQQLVATPQVLTTSKRLAVGGLGALTPILINLFVIDLAVVFGRFDWLAVFSYLLRLMALFAAGALVAWLHRNENDTSKLFQLGIVAPALLTAALNGANARANALTAPADGTSAGQIVMSWLAAPLHAQQSPHVYSFDDPPPETTGEKIRRGLAGRVNQRVWFVFLTQGSVTPAEAMATLRSIDQDLKDSSIQPRVYESGGPVKGHAIAFGYWMAEADAVRLENKLRAKGLNVFRWPATTKSVVR